MTDQEWLQCDDPEPMIEFLLKKRDRKMRLAAVAACRLFLSGLTDERSQEAVEVAERFADGQATDNELKAARGKADAATRGLYHAWRATPVADDRDAESAFYAAEAAASAASEESEEAFSHLAGIPGYEFLLANLLRDVFGPMTRVSFNLSWLSPTVMALANAIYDGRRFEDMPVLADALEEANCTDAVILEHCRHTTPYLDVPRHARGCWVLDLLLGRSEQTTPRHGRAKTSASGRGEKGGRKKGGKGGTEKGRKRGTS